MTPLIRYTLLQIPGWLLLGILLWWAEKADWITVSTAGWIMAAWLAKDAILYPVCRSAFEGNQPRETDQYIGKEAEVVKALTPEGLISLNGENWTARINNNEEINVGTRVRVIKADGLILFVEPLT